MAGSTVKKIVQKVPHLVMDSEPARNGHSNSQILQVKKKKSGARSWMRFDASGVSELLELDRNAIMQRSWIPARDLRILGPVFSQTAHIVARERAMVVNLEFIKAIVTAEDLYLLDANDTAVRPFVEQLKEQFPLQAATKVFQDGQAGHLFVEKVKEEFPLQSDAQVFPDKQQEHFFMEHEKEQGPFESAIQVQEEGHHELPTGELLKEQFPVQGGIRVSLEGQEEPADWTLLDDCTPIPLEEWSENENSAEDLLADTLPEDLDWTMLDAPSSNSPAKWSQNGNLTEEGLPEILPFEFRILEIALDVVCRYLEDRVTDLERRAYPALDELTQDVTTSNLELVRSLKTVLTRLTARVQKVRNELEQLLDDDADMADFYLTRKFTLFQHIDSPAVSVGGDHQTLSSLGFYKASTFNAAASTVSTVSAGDLLDVEELEMLLEAYFMQLDRSLNKLTIVRQYIDDTEDYVNIQLDHQRNQLFQFQITLAAAGLALGVATSCYGAFGMNIQIPLYQNNDMFKPVVVGALAASAGVFLGVIAYVRWKGLFER